MMAIHDNREHPSTLRLGAATAGWLFQAAEVLMVRDTHCVLPREVGLL